MGNLEGGENLIAHTLPNSWLSSYSHHDNTRRFFNPGIPYRKVIRLTPSDGESVAAFGFENVEGNEEVMAFNAMQSGFLLEYFRRHYADTSGQPPLHNCHSFAEKMLGLPDLQPHLQEQIILRGHQTRVIKSGQIGLLGYMDGNKTPKPSHSVIGTDENIGECISVLGVRGDMGITSCDDLMRYSKSFTGGIFRTLRGVTRLGIYTVRGPIRFAPASNPESSQSHI